MAADIELREEKEKKEEREREVFDSVFLFLYLGPVHTTAPPNGGRGWQSESPSPLQFSLKSGNGDPESQDWVPSPSRLFPVLCGMGPKF
jgi:hypothetical protein